MIPALRGESRDGWARRLQGSWTQAGRSPDRKGGTARRQSMVVAAIAVVAISSSMCRKCYVTNVVFPHGYSGEGRASAQLPARMTGSVGFKVTFLTIKPDLTPEERSDWLDTCLKERPDEQESFPNRYNMAADCSRPVAANEPCSLCGAGKRRSKCTGLLTVFGGGIAVMLEGMD